MIQLNFAERGSGEVLILLHGNGEDLTYFEHQIEYFSKQYRVIALDTRGHGGSPRSDAPFTIRQFAEDLRAFMDASGIRRAHLLGFSDGGNIAMVFALKYPDRVNRLILNGANLYARGVKLHVQLPIEIGYRIAKLFAKRRSEARKNAEMLGLMVNDPALKPEMLKSLRMPVLVIAGTRDMIRESHTRLIHKSLPNAKLVLLPGSHFIAHECPEPFNRAVEEFLKANPPCAD